MLRRWLAIRPQNFWLLFGGIWLLVGLPFLGIGLSVAWRLEALSDQLDREGRAVEAQVLEKKVRTSTTTNATAYLVTFQFTRINGEILTDTAEVSLDAWEPLREGGVVRVTYLPVAPQIHRIDGQVLDAVLPLVFGSIGFVLTSLGGFVFVRGLGQLRAAERAHRKGLSDTGTVRYDRQRPDQSVWKGKD